MISAAVMMIISFFSTSFYCFSLSVDGGLKLERITEIGLNRILEKSQDVRPWDLIIQVDNWIPDRATLTHAHALHRRRGLRMYVSLTDVVVQAQTSRSEGKSHSLSICAAEPKARSALPGAIRNFPRPPSLQCLNETE